MEDGVALLTKLMPPACSFPACWAFRVNGFAFARHLISAGLCSGLVRA